MMAILPILLEGDNLGKRHKYLNHLVNEAFNNGIPFESIRNVPEQSAVDRLFKIDLAAKYKNVDYIVHTLKDEDMLYVSRAMKCKWLVTDEKYKEIINPDNLEQNLYPEMRTDATNKMKHWIQHNLKNEKRNKEFYEYYKNKDINYAFKFLPKCPAEFFIEEMKAISADKISPQFLKLLCERCTKSADIYFKNLKQSGEATENYITKMQILLKTDPDTYFYVIEHFFLESFKRLNKKASRYIMKHHRDRFDTKSELYTARVLDLHVLAQTLTNEEIKELILKLARAHYVNRKIDYEFAKPLIKAIDSKERSKFCEMVFTEKLYGDPIKDAPYLIPTKPVIKRQFNIELDPGNELYDIALKGPPQLRPLCAEKGRRKFKRLTDLDKLYNEYRFKSFEVTFKELRKRIPKESNMTNRQNMILVLISKTGGRTDSVQVLLKYLIQKHSNEPANVCATIVRSFVKRAYAWRWPEDNWNLLLQFAKDLGLDGSLSTVECREGFHAQILRHIILKGELLPEVWDAFVKDFSPLTDYKLNSSERQLLHERLPAMLLATTTPPETYVQRLTAVCDALENYKINIGTYPGAIDAIATFARNHPLLAKPLLLRIFKSRIARKLLFKENFEIIQTDASYVNALWHDAAILSDEKFKDLLENIKDLNHDQFLRKLALYFSEKEGLATRYMKVLERKAADSPHVKLARPMALLSGSHNIDWPNLPVPNEKVQLQKYRQMMASLQSNSHLARNKLPLALESKSVSLAALANWIETCSPKALQSGMKTLITFPRHARLVLALRGVRSTGLIAEILPHAAKTRPLRTFRLVLRLLRKHHEVFQPQDFTAFKLLLSTLDLKGKAFDRYCDLVRLDAIPKFLRAEYSLILYQNLAKVGFGPDIKCQTRVHYRIAVPLIRCIRNHMDEFDASVVSAILKEYINKQFTSEVLIKSGIGNSGSFEYYWDFRKYTVDFIKIIARYLLNGKSNEDTKNRLREIYDPFEQVVKEMWSNEEIHYKREFRKNYFFVFLMYVQYAKVFSSEEDFSFPVLERLCSFGDEIAPISENFPLNQRIRFICLFRQAVKLCINEKGDLCKGENYRPLFVAFGKVIAQDIEDTIARYFPSIRLIYTFVLRSYLICHFYPIDTVNPLIEGLLNDDTKTNAVILGLSFFNKDCNLDGRNKVNDKIESLVNDRIKNAKCEEIKFYTEFSEYRRCCCDWH